MDLVQERKEVSFSAFPVLPLMGPRDGGFEGPIVFCRRREWDAAFWQATMRSTSTDIPLMPIHVPKDPLRWVVGIQLHQGRRGLGTEQLSSQTKLTNRDQRFGDLKGSQRQLARNNSSRRRWKKKVWPKRGGQRSRQCQICNVFGSYCSKAQTRGEPHHAHHAPECFSCVLPRARQGHLGHCQNLVGWSPKANAEDSQQLSTFLMMGGLGLRSAVKCAPAVYCASWADDSQMISQRTPEVAHDVHRRQRLEEPIGGCLGELHHQSWTARAFGGDPELHEGKRFPKTEIRKPGEWPHGLGFLPSLTPLPGRARC